MHIFFKNTSADQVNNNFPLCRKIPFIFMKKSSIFISRINTIKNNDKGGTRNYFHVIFTLYLVRHRIYFTIMDTPNLIIFRLDETGLKVYCSMQREPRIFTMGMESHSSAANNNKPNLSMIHQFSLAVKLEGLLCQM